VEEKKFRQFFFKEVRASFGMQKFSIKQEPEINANGVVG
jgi:hypothetical protein